MLAEHEHTDVNYMISYNFQLIKKSPCQFQSSLIQVTIPTDAYFQVMRQVMRGKEVTLMFWFSFTKYVIYETWFEED